MKKAIRWKDPVDGVIGYWHDSHLRWCSDPNWIEDRNTLLYRLHEARFYFPESAEDIKIVKPSKSVQHIENLEDRVMHFIEESCASRNEILSLKAENEKLHARDEEMDRRTQEYSDWIDDLQGPSQKDLIDEVKALKDRCSNLDNQVADLLDNEMRLKDELKVLDADLKEAQDNSAAKLLADMDKHSFGCEARFNLSADCNCCQYDPHPTETFLDHLLAPLTKCFCLNKDNNKPQRYHVMTCHLSGYVIDHNTGEYVKASDYYE